MNKEHNQDFNTALNIYENEYSHEYLINLLKNGSVVEKQTATLKLDKVFSQEEAYIFVSNLTGCDGKIREAVSFRLQEFIPQNPELYTNFQDTFIEAVIDINGNICRNTISAISVLKNYPQFYKDFCTKLVEKTNEIIKKVQQFDFQEGKYKINKEVFKLYWYLETIFEFKQHIDINQLKSILANSSKIEEYTIREKTAKILSLINEDEDLLKIKKKLKNDANYYVRRL